MSSSLSSRTIPSGVKLTPMLEQYLRIKEEHPDALLFFRMGDFYELFFEDARTASRELQIALTSRNPNADFSVPMCGVPHHSSEEYLRQLLEKGIKWQSVIRLKIPEHPGGWSSGLSPGCPRREPWWRKAA